MIPIDEVVHFDAQTSTPSTSAAVDADSTPTFSVFEEDTDTAIVTGNLTKRTGLTGEYRGQFTASAANGFEAGKWYNVKAYATVGGVAGKAVVMRFRVAPAESSAGVPKSDVSHFGGSAGTFASGRPEVNNIDKAGYGLADGAITAAKIASDAFAAAKFASDFFAAIITAVWITASSRVLTAFGFHVQLATTQDEYAPAKAGDAMTLTSAYDAAKTAASQATADADHDLTQSAIATALTNIANVAAAAAALITADHGSGSYVRNTEPPSAATIATTAGAREIIAGLTQDLALRLAAAGTAGLVASPAAGQAGPVQIADVGVALAGSDNLVEGTVDANGQRTAVTVNP